MSPLRIALRRLMRRPAFTAAGVTTVAVAIALNATLFAIFESLLLRPLPVPDPESLVRIGLAPPGQAFGPMSLAELAEVKEISTLSEVAGHQIQDVILDPGGAPRDGWAEIVTPGYFSLLSLRALEGRLEVGSRQAVVAERTRNALFGVDVPAVGRPLAVNGTAFTIVGVLPRGYDGALPGFEAGVWIGDRDADVIYRGADVDDPGHRFLMGLARVSDAAAAESLPLDLDVVLGRLADRFGTASYDRLGFAVAPASGVHPAVQQIIRTFLVVMQVLVGLVLVVACVNLATLTLVRASQSHQEAAIRMALGAGPGRLFRSSTLESLVLAGLGGAVGLVLTGVLVHEVSGFRPVSSAPLVLTLSVSGAVVGFTLGITLLTGLFFAVLPAARVARTAPAAALNRGRGMTDARGQRLRSTLVVVQVAVTAMLLVASGLLIRSLGVVAGADPGFRTSDVWIVAADPGLLGYDATRTSSYWESVVEEARALPGVSDASAALFVLLGDRSDRMTVVQPPQEAPAGVGVDYNAVLPGFLEHIEVPLLRGRTIASTDGEGAPPVAVVSDAFVRRFWPEGDALGRSFTLVDRDGERRDVAVVGVTADVAFNRIGAAPAPYMYVPARQFPRSDLVLHLTATAPDVLPDVVAAMQRVDPSVALSPSHFEEATRFNQLPTRVAASVLASAGAITLLLSLTGLFATTWLGVELRRKEFGIRLALGQSPPRLRRRIRLTCARHVALGALLGIPGALLVARVLGSVLFGVPPLDVPTIAGVLALLAVAALAAAQIPASTASRVHPATVLQAD